MKRIVLFHRKYKGFRGAHLTVWHFFNHVLHSPDHEPYVCFSKDSIWDEMNPWHAARDHVVESWRSMQPDVFFFGGRDWLMLEPGERDNSPIPILNAIQQIKHTLPSDARYAFLKHKAIRICISEEIGAAVRETGQANGPVFVIPSATDVGELTGGTTIREKDCDILIAALKRPEVGQQLKLRLDRKGRRVDVLNGLLPRPEYLRRVSQARITVFLPNQIEGFYRPPLEGMALGTVVVCPQAAGVSGCEHGRNCFHPDYTVEGIMQAVNDALALSPDQANAMLEKGRRTVERHNMAKHREAFLQILNNVGSLW